MKRTHSPAYAEPNSSMIVFSSELCHFLSKERLAPVYVGVRSVRPTSASASVDAPGGSSAPLDPPVYKVVTEDGQERRMTTQEKKRAKLQYKLQQASQRDQQNIASPEQATVPEDCVVSASQASSKHYVQLTVDPMLLAEELAEGRLHRASIPPLLLSPPMAQCAAQYIPSVRPSSPPCLTLVDDDRAAQWAVALQQRILQPAERIRQRETGVRPLPYRIVPQVWSRLRPEGVMTLSDDLRPPFTTDEERDWSWCSMRPPRPDPFSIEDDLATPILQVLHPHVHISCGAKFGCHYLLYDGPRHERHAFAGLRILPHRHPEHLPLPNAYDLAGYVRGLNTAGKLALLATTVADDNMRVFVLFLDLALEKIAVTTSRRPNKTLEQRLQNLAKHPPPPP